ncbi:MAG: site-specific DNA-methyltransferase [Candidatus Omnitrophota bacterium]|jgi:DNA modification methylase|nr:MAG: site-specific DNA-methyltransferase [Candidatus Omnitrophota bacterium]
MGVIAISHTHQPFLFEAIEKSDFDRLKGNCRCEERIALHQVYASRLSINPTLNRQLVSFQANKETPYYRWFKYKEAYSARLVKSLLHFAPYPQNETIKILDPFAGVGTTLTVAAEEGYQAIGIEIMPIGVAAMKSRIMANSADLKSFRFYLNQLESLSLSTTPCNGYRFPHLRITQQAFSQKTESALSSFVKFLKTIKNDRIRYLFWFACLSILEDVSYTRKDGQYLRWDSRSGRRLKSNFYKGEIPDFKDAILWKLRQISEDITLQKPNIRVDQINVIEGSCLSELIKLPEESIHLVVTSPPYCNRYDYTRTYALELAFMNYDEDSVKKLRQTMLSCTVENKDKKEQIIQQYSGQDRENFFRTVEKNFNHQKALHEILAILQDAKKNKELNNNNIPNLVENYFFEMNVVIHELARVLKPGGRVFMVNDNVQYLGEEIPVDLILSDLASMAGFHVDHIWILPKGKGNSSQQMGIHGRNELRKCIYVWSKP